MKPTVLLALVALLSTFRPQPTLAAPAPTDLKPVQAEDYTLVMPDGWEDQGDEADRDARSPVRESSLLASLSGDAGGVFMVMRFAGQGLASVREQQLKAVDGAVKRERGVKVAGIAAERYAYAAPDGNDEPCSVELMFLQRGSDTFEIVSSYHTRCEEPGTVKADLEAIRQSWTWHDRHAVRLPVEAPGGLGPLRFIPKQTLRAARAGEPAAEVIVAQSLQLDFARGADAPEARRWYELAAEGGSADAAGFLGQDYEIGMLGPVDLPRSLAMYQRAAKQGDVAAMARAGHMLRNGMGTKADFAEARRWLELAASCDEPSAGLELGLMSGLGQGMATDPARARWLIERAASRLGDARYFLGPLAPPFTPARRHPRDAFLHALAQLWGLEGPADAAAARAAFVKLADAGRPDAAYFAGRLTYEAGRTPSATKAARSWYRQSARGGYPAGEVAMGGLNETDTTAEEQQRWLADAARQGDPEAEVLMAGRYDESSGHDERRKGWLDRAIAHGSARAARELSRAYEMSQVAGSSIEDTIVQNHRWLRVAAEWGDCQAACDLGVLILEGSHHEGAVPWLVRGARDRRTHAAGRLAEVYRKGDGTRQDLKAACRWWLIALDQGDEVLPKLVELVPAATDLPWAELQTAFKRAATYGDPNALRGLGLMQALGRGTTRNPRLAKERFDQAIEKGDAAAMAALGDLYAASDSPLHDDALAVAWYKKASKNGETAVLVRLARLIRDGRGVKADVGGAIATLERAGANGYGEAYDELGSMYAHGLGVPRDLSKARHYFEKAIENEWAPARGHLKAMR